MENIDNHDDKTTTVADVNSQKWGELLRQAVTQPGLMHKAYSAFHGYSLGNQLAALLQCQLRHIEPGPIDTYKGWLDKGRQVRKGQKAIWLCMPLTRKKKNDDTGEDEEFITCFVWRPHWFVLSQTDGEPVPMPELKRWDKARALEALDISQIQFSHTDGNAQGYAEKRAIAISPLAALPHKTLFHELAHVVLGHTEQSAINDSDHTPKSLCEAERKPSRSCCANRLNYPAQTSAGGTFKTGLKAKRSLISRRKESSGRPTGFLRPGWSPESSGRKGRRGRDAYARRLAKSDC